MRQVLENLFGIEKDFFQSFFKVVFQQSVSRRSLPERLAAAPVSSKRLFFPNLNELLFHRKTGSAEPFERMGPRFGVHRIFLESFLKVFSKSFGRHGTLCKIRFSKVSVDTNNSGGNDWASGSCEKNFFTKFLEFFVKFF